MKVFVVFSFFKSILYFFKKKSESNYVVTETKMSPIPPTLRRIDKDSVFSFDKFILKEALCVIFLTYHMCFNMYIFDHS